jgi:hypothetical protein
MKTIGAIITGERREEVQTLLDTGVELTIIDPTLALELRLTAVAVTLLSIPK